MPTEHILVVGGAGFIGSHMVDRLKRSSFIPLVLDNLSTGHRDAVLDAELIVGDMNDRTLLDHIFSHYSIAGVMHFASFIEVGESVKNPLKYYSNNVGATLTLLQAVMHWKIKAFIFSSTAAVYGEPQYTPIDEVHPKKPINPYGKSKRMVEMMLQDFSDAYDLHVAILRYFNAAGADPSGKLSERHEPESHLIPRILRAAKDPSSHINIYGADYPTPDGTCVRDYVHVNDLCEAHLLAFYALLNGKKWLTYNLGTGKGYSVQEVVNTAKIITQCDISIGYEERRAGDPAILVADAKRAMKELNWRPLYSDLQTIIEHAWKASE